MILKYKLKIIESKVLNKNFKIIEVGCGKSGVSNYLYERGYKNIKSIDIIECDAVNFEKKDCWDEDYSEYDVLIFWGVFTLLDIRKFLKKLEREMKEGAILIFAIANICSFSRRLKCLLGINPAISQNLFLLFTFKEVEELLNEFSFSKKEISGSNKDCLKNIWFPTTRNLSNDIIGVIQR